MKAEKTREIKQTEKQLHSETREMDVGNEASFDCAVVELSELANCEPSAALPGRLVPRHKKQASSSGTSRGKQNEEEEKGEQRRKAGGHRGARTECGKADDEMGRTGRVAMAGMAPLGASARDGAARHRPGGAAAVHISRRACDAHRKRKGVAGAGERNRE